MLVTSPATVVAHTLMNDEYLSPGGPSAGAAARLDPIAPLSGLAGLVDQMAQGRQDALARLYDETSSVLNGLLLRILDRPEDSEEVLLDVYMKAWRYAPRYSEKARGVTPCPML